MRNPDGLVTIEDVELELRRRQYADPLSTVYGPHDGQIKIHRARAPLTLVLGGNRSGKSWAAVAEALYYCLGRSTWAEVPEPPIMVFYVMPSFGMFERAIYPIFKKLVPWDQVEKFSERDHYCKFTNGSYLYFLSADQRFERHQGAQVNFVVMDESPNESVYGELIARLIATRGRMLMVLAPVDAKSYWIRDKIYVPWMAGDDTELEVIHMPTADEEGRSLVPHLSDDDIRRLEKRWTDPGERAARLYGDFIVRSGLVFKGFDPDTHVIKPFEIPDHFVRWWVVDPQYYRFAALQFAADEDGNYYVTDEYFSQEEPLADRAERMAAITGKVERSIPVYVDSANPQDIAELNYHFDRIGASLGAVSLPMQKQVHKMVLRVHSYIEPDIDRKYPKYAADMKNLYGSPRIFFFDTLRSYWVWNGQRMDCSRLTWEMGRLSWGKNGKPDKDSADGADCSDCVIYGTSINAAGVRNESRDKWKEGLSPDDIMIWNAIDKMDRWRRDPDYLDYD